MSVGSTREESLANQDANILCSQTHGDKTTLKRDRNISWELLRSNETDEPGCRQISLWFKVPRVEIGDLAGSEMCFDSYTLSGKHFGTLRKEK